MDRDVLVELEERPDGSRHFRVEAVDHAGTELGVQPSSGAAQYAEKGAGVRMAPKDEPLHYERFLDPTGEPRYRTLPTQPSPRGVGDRSSATGEAASWVPIEDLEPWDRNPKKNDHRIGVAMRQLRTYGFGTPMVRWQGPGWLVAGNARLKAMRRILDEDPQLDGKGGTNKKLAKTNARLRTSLNGPSPRHLPVRLMHFDSEADAEAYAMVDNNQIGEWDPDALVDAVARVSAAGHELESLGFNADTLAELDKARQARGEEFSGGPKIPAGVTYKSQHGVIVMCDGEEHQERVFNALQAEGYKCKIVVT